MKSIDRDILSKNKGYTGFLTKEEIGSKIIDTPKIYFSTYEAKIDKDDESIDIYNTIISRHVSDGSNNLENTLWITLNDIRVEMDYAPEDNTLRVSDQIELNGTDDEKAAAYEVRNIRFSKEISVSGPDVHVYRFENGLIEAVLDCVYDNKINFSLFKKCLSTLPSILIDNNITEIERVFVPVLCKKYQKINNKDSVVFNGVAIEVLDMFIENTKQGIFSSNKTFAKLPKRIDIVNIFKEKKEVPKTKSNKKNIVVNTSYNKNYNKKNNGYKPKPANKPRRSSNNGGYVKQQTFKPYNPKNNNYSYNKKSNNNNYKKGR